MKKICLVLSFIICLLCFVGCKDNNQDVVNPNVPDNPNQEQSGSVLPGDDENENVESGEVNPDEDLSGDDAPEINIPDDSNENNPAIPDDGNNEETPDNGNEVENPNNGENVENSDNNEEIENPDDEVNTGSTNPSASVVMNKMTNIVTKAGAEVMMPMQDAIPAESSLGFIGLSEEDFNKYVTESVVYESMISPAFQSICIVKVNDTSKIADLKKSILDNSNPRKWICSSAEKVVVVDCGEYIMLAMSTEDLCGKLVTAFGEEMGGTLGETLTKAGDL